MTHYKFNILPKDEQALTIWEYGVHIAGRKEGEFELLLYQIDAFYVEVWYNRKDNEIKKFRSFSSINALEPNLKKITIRI